VGEEAASARHGGGEQTGRKGNFPCERESRDDEAAAQQAESSAYFMKRKWLFCNFQRKTVEEVATLK